MVIEIKAVKQKFDAYYGWDSETTRFICLKDI